MDANSPMPDLHYYKPNGTLRRWYDQEPACREVLHHLQHMDVPAVQAFAANFIAHLAEEVQTTLHLRSGSAPKTLGLAGIKETYLSRSQNKRWYDQKPHLKQAVSRFYTLPMQGLAALCFKLQEPMGLLATYSYVCQQLGQQPQEEDMTQLMRVGLFEGVEQAEDTLKALVGIDLYTALLNERTPTVPE
jgi:hypothetical protein